MYNKNFAWKKGVVLFLVVSITASGVLFTRPQKTDAFLGCLLNKFIGKGITAASGAADAATSVPIYSRILTSLVGDIKAEEQAQTTKECVWDFAVKVVGKILIKQITKSIVTWINSGFNGSPSFVTNIDGFMEDIGDQVIGESIRSLGGIGELLCSPFDVDLRFALNIHFSATYSDYVACRLTDIQKNVQNAFSGGTFGGRAGWNQWFALHSSPQNNPYGSFLSLTSNMEAKIAGRHEIGLRKLDWGRGFMSWETCPSGDTDSEDAYAERLQGKCTINTPGSVIEGQLQEVLPSQLRELEVADEINEIMNALMNQALVQVISATGLAGTSRPRSDQRGSYFDTFVSGNTDDDFNREVAGAIAEIPPGIGIECEQFNRDKYVVRENIVYLQPYLLGSGTFGAEDRPMKDDQTPWTVGEYEAVKNYCAGQTLRGHYTGEDANRPEDGTSQLGTTPEEIESQRENIALLKKTKQSSTYHFNDLISFYSDQAVDGSTSLSSMTGEQSSESWWEVDLAEDNSGKFYVIEDMDKIEIVSRGTDWSSYFKVFLSNTPFKANATTPELISDPNVDAYDVFSNLSSVTIEIPTGPRRYIRMQRQEGGLLAFGEVRVYGIQKRSDAPAVLEQ
ncbi:MAG: hypothetical protein Q8P86_02675 [bacterium]|nr:hypothetical protein [bacterium]